TIKNALEKTQLPVAQSSSQAPSSVKAAESLSQYKLKTILFDKMDKSRSYLTHEKHQDLFDALLNSILLDDVVARGQADRQKTLRKRDHDNEDPLAGPNQGKKTKRSITKDSKPSKKSSTSKETSKGKSHVKTSKSSKSMIVEEPVFGIASDDIKQTVDDVASDADQPLDDSTWTKNKAPKQDCIKNKLDWNNSEGDHCPFDLTNPLPLKGRPDRLTIAAEYFFNNDLEFLKSLDPEKKYTTSIIKTKAAWYKIVGIEDMFPTLWCATKVSDIVDLIVALCMFTRSLIIKRRVTDLKLGVEGVINEDLNKHKRVIQADELYKFSDETLKTVHDELHHRILDFRLGYNMKMSRRKWMAIDKRRLKLMVKLIDKRTRERRIIRNLERFVGAQELEMDYRLMTRNECSSGPILNLIL
nr:hypothetical protein [Tanacetum cinerariifolium]